MKVCYNFQNVLFYICRVCIGDIFGFFKSIDRKFNFGYQSFLIINKVLFMENKNIYEFVICLFLNILGGVVVGW